MKSLIITLCSVLLSIGLVNCGGSDDSPAVAAKTDNGVASGVEKVDYSNGAIKVSYFSGNNTTDFYNTYSNGSKKCLAKTADDKTVGEIYVQLMAYLSSGTISKGSLDSVGPNPRYITVTYSDGSQRTFNLNNDSATTSEDTLSNGKEISDYLDALYQDINDNPNAGDCTLGKKNK